MCQLNLGKGIRQAEWVPAASHREPENDSVVSGAKFMMFAILQLLLPAVFCSLGSAKPPCEGTALS